MMIFNVDDCQATISRLNMRAVVTEGYFFKTFHVGHKVLKEVWEA